MKKIVCMLIAVFMLLSLAACGQSAAPAAARAEPQIVTVEKEPERWVNCHWEDSVRSDFKATFYIDAFDRPDLLSDVLAQLSSMHIALHSVSAREADNGYAVIEATIAANSVDQLNMVLARVARVPSVISVKR